MHRWYELKEGTTATIHECDCEWFGDHVFDPKDYDLEPMDNLDRLIRNDANRGS